MRVRRRQVMGRLSVLCLISLGAACEVAPGGSAGGAVVDDGEMKVVLLGTGTPNADPERSGPSVAVVVRGSSYIFDFGPGVVRRAAAAAEKYGLTALQPQNLKTAFATHLHHDHTGGLPDLILTPWTLERESPLQLYGPPGTKAMAEGVLDAYGEDIRVRLDGLEPANPEGWRVEAEDVLPGVVYQDSLVTVVAFSVPHGAWEHAYGYRVSTETRTIVISGDTRPSPAIADQCLQCDLLIHEVYSQAGFERRPPEWQAYHRNSHTSAFDLGRIAAQARPGLLVLYHQLFWGASEEELLEEVRSVYGGEVVSGHDLDIY